MDRTNQHIFLLFALLLFYAAGPVLVLVWGVASIGVAGKIEDEALINVLSTFASSPGAYTSVLHQMIVPVAAAVTAANHSAILTHRLSRWLFIVPLATVFVCLCDALLLSSLLVVEAGDEVTGQVPATGAISQVFLGTAGTLATYVMLLVGLQAAAGEAPASAKAASDTEGDDYRGSLAWSSQTTESAPTSAPTPTPTPPGVG